jgi:hypothetical protein
MIFEASGTTVPTPENHEAQFVLSILRNLLEDYSKTRTLQLEIISEMKKRQGVQELTEANLIPFLRDLVATETLTHQAKQTIDQAETLLKDQPDNLCNKIIKLTQQLFDIRSVEGYKLCPCTI